MNFLLPLRSLRFFSSRVYASHAIYKKAGVISFTANPPNFENKGTYESVKYPGKIKVDMSPAKSISPDGMAVYDWNSKMTANLSVADIGLIMTRGWLKKTNGVYSNNYGSQNSQGDTAILDVRRGFSSTNEKFLKFVLSDGVKQLSIALEAHETYILERLFDNSIVYLMGWERSLTASARDVPFYSKGSFPDMTPIGSSMTLEQSSEVDSFAKAEFSSDGESSSATTGDYVRSNGLPLATEMKQDDFPKSLDSDQETQTVARNNWQGFLSSSQISH